MEIIIFIFVAWVSRVKLELSWLKTVIVAWISAYVLYSTIEMVLSFAFHYGDTLKVIGVILVGSLFYNKYSDSAQIRNWRNTNYPSITSFEFSSILLGNCDLNKVRYYQEIPYNRAKFFSLGSETDIDMDFVSTIFYHASPADNEMIFQEYGFMVTSTGVLIKKQKPLSKEQGRKTFGVESTYLPFANAYKVSTTSNALNVCYADRTRKGIVLSPSEVNFLEEVFYFAIQSGWTYHVEDVIGEGLAKEEDVEIINSKVENYESKMDDLDSAVNHANQNIRVDTSNQQSSFNAIQGTIPILQSELNQNQINDRFGGGQGHGHVGEQYGDLYDKLHWRKTEKFGASHEKNGADRSVSGFNIQTKYCATAGKSIGQCFDSNSGSAKYLNPDGSMMVIEVPKNQYPEAVRKMSEKIKQGKVPNESNPANAGKYVKKGPITYEQAEIATKSIFDRKTQITARDKNGKVIKDSNGQDVKRDVTFREKLVWSAGGDFLTGATASLPMGVVSGVWVYCNNIWQGVDKKTALKNSAIATAKPCLAGGMMYMVSSQFAGSKIGKKIGEEYANRILKKDVSKKLITQGVTKGTMAILTVAITIGPDLTDCLRGRISMNQLVKNSVATGTGMATGAALGGAIGSVIPVVGTAIGSVVGGSIGAMGARKILDNFIEDDAISMIRIAKEEFIETVMMSALSEEEFNSILGQTFLHKKFSKLLKDMYAVEESREYIHGQLHSLVKQAYDKRELPNEEDIIHAARMHYSALQTA